MPFRIPNGYDRLDINGHDPLPAELVEYVEWLERELVLTRAALVQLQPPAPPGKPRKPNRSEE